MPRDGATKHQFREPLVPLLLGLRIVRLWEPGRAPVWHEQVQIRDGLAPRPNWNSLLGVPPHYCAISWVDDDIEVGQANEAQQLDHHQHDSVRISTKVLEPVRRGSVHCTILDHNAREAVHPMKGVVLSLVNEIRCDSSCPRTKIALGLAGKCFPTATLDTQHHWQPLQRASDAQLLNAPAVRGGNISDLFWHKRAWNEGANLQLCLGRL